MNNKDQVLQISAWTIVKVVCVLIIFWVLFILKDLLLVVLMSVLVASAVEPGAQWFKSRGIPRLFGVILIYLLIGLSLVGLILFLVVPFLSESVQFLRDFIGYFNTNSLASSVNNNSFLSSGSFVSGITNSLNIEELIHQINVVAGSIYTDTFGTVATFFGGVLSFILIIILSFYLSVEKDGVEKFLKAVTTIKHEKYVVELWKRSQKKIGLWMQGQLVLAIIIGMLVYLGLLIMDVPNALLLATLAGAFEIIPLFGPILAAIPAMVIAFVSGGFSLTLMVAGLYIVVQQFENHLIYPLVVKKVVGVSPVVSIVALAAGWQLAGLIGIILAVPVSSIIIEFLTDLEKDKIEQIERMAIKE